MTPSQTAPTSGSVPLAAPLRRAMEALPYYWEALNTSDQDQVMNQALHLAAEPVAALASWRWLGRTAGYMEDVHVYRDLGRDEWALVPLGWRMEVGFPDPVPWEQCTPATRSTILALAASRIWASSGFEAFIESLLDLVATAQTSSSGEQSAARVRAVCRVVHDPATEPVRLLAALRLP